MRLSLDDWDLLTKHAHPNDRAWNNRDVRELVVYAIELQMALAAREIPPRPIPVSFEIYDDEDD